MERKITIEEATVYQEDYQMRMLHVNEIEGILPVKGRGIDEASFYDYNVSGKISMKAMFERTKISGEDLKLFLRQLLSVIREIQNYLLNIHCILMEPEFIFYEDGRFYFCYYPLAKQELWTALHKLTEYFVKQADYEDKESVRIVFVLHKETMIENYSLEKVVKECIKETNKTDKEEKKSGIRVQKFCCEDKSEDEYEEYEIEGNKQRDYGASGSEYDSAQHEWIKKQHHGNLIMEETENMWTPVKRFLNRQKKPKWGDWDGLYIEEEEL